MQIIPRHFGLEVRPDALDNQLDLFDSRLNELKAKKWNRDCLKYLHYGKENDGSEGTTQKASNEKSNRS